MDHLLPLIIQSGQLFLIGMGTVFIILVMLIFCITLISKLLPEEKVVPFHPVSQPTSAESKASTSTNNSELVAVISATIKAFKNRHKVS
jgi:sodium pump decarboxylase gamma subunit